MYRREYLTAFSAATVWVAGCLSDDTPTALSPPDRAVSSDDLAYPAHGERLPEVELDSPLHDQVVSTTEFVDAREVLMTFVFTRCPGPCHTLTAALAHAQADANEHGYESELALMPVTFDPEHDDRLTLEEFSRDNGADPTAANWQFLRPETPTEAETVVGETFGVGFEEVPPEEADHDDHGHHDDDHETTFIHTNLLVLVNRDGYVERAYDGQPPSADVILDDLHTVRDTFA